MNAVRSLVEVRVPDMGKKRGKNGVLGGVSYPVRIRSGRLAAALK